MGKVHTFKECFTLSKAFHRNVHLFRSNTRSWRSRNWCSDYWVEYVYLRARASLLSIVNLIHAAELNCALVFVSKFKLFCSGLT